MTVSVNNNYITLPTKHNNARVQAKQDKIVNIAALILKILGIALFTTSIITGVMGLHIAVPLSLFSAGIAVFIALGILRCCTR